MALFGFLGILSVLWPPEVGPPPVAGIEVTNRPWNFWWMFTLENWWGLSAILYAEIAFFALLAILPFVDRNPNRLWRRRPVVMTVAFVVLAAMVALTVLLGVTPAKQHLGM